MSDVPSVELAPGVQVRTVVGTTGSFSIGDFEPGSAAVLHHHTREQGDIGIAGEFAMTLGEGVEKLGLADGAIVPPDVAHSIANNGKARATVIEFHTVRRPDLVPPRPALTFPALPTPVARSVPRLIQPMDGASRESAGRVSWLRGETCLMGWRRLPSGAAPVELRAGRVERFVYVLRGEIQMAHEGTRERIGSGSLVVVPAGAMITIQAVGTEDAAVAEFIPGLETVLPVEEEPRHKNVLNNAYVQAFRVTLASGESTLPHTHRFDDAAVRLSEATVTSNAPGQAPGSPESSVPGLVTVRNNAAKPLTHRVQNPGKTVFDVLDVQILARPAGPTTAPIQTPVAENAMMRAYRYELAAGDQVEHTHNRPYVFIAVTASRILTMTSAGEKSEQTLMAGDLHWVETPRAHTLVNRGKDKAILVEFEIK